MSEFKDAARGIPIETCGRKELDKRSDGMVHQGVILEADPLPVVRADAWDVDALPSDAIVVLLDQIEDPHNFGAIARSACACGAAALVFTKDRGSPLSPAATKSAAGALEYIDLVQATNLARCIDTLKESGFWIAGMAGESEDLLWSADLKGRIGVVIGNEGRGLRRLTRERCDMLLRIPLKGPVTSLNASTSAAIALTECLRQRVSDGQDR